MQTAGQPPISKKKTLSCAISSERGGKVIPRPESIPPADSIPRSCLGSAYSKPISSVIRKSRAIPGDSRSTRFPTRRNFPSNQRPNGGLLIRQRTLEHSASLSRSKKASSGEIIILPIHFEFMRYIEGRLDEATQATDSATISRLRLPQPSRASPARSGVSDKSYNARSAKRKRPSNSPASSKKRS